MKYCVAIDGSDASKYAIQLLKYYFKPGDDALVVSIGPFDPTMFDFLDPDGLALQKARLHTKAETIVNACLKDLQSEGIENAKGLCEVGSVRELLVDLTEKEDFDLLIVGSRGLGLVNRVLVGSVSEYVMKHAKCNVLVARAPQTET